MFKAIKNLVCLTRHKAHWLCLSDGSNLSNVAAGQHWTCTKCDRHWYQSIASLLPTELCSGCLRFFHPTGLDTQGRCAACTFREDYVKAVAGGQILRADAINAGGPLQADAIDAVQLTAPQPVEVTYGMAIMTPPGTPYYPPGKDMGLHTGGAFHFTGKAPAPKPAEKVQPSDSSYSNLPHPRAILRGRTATEGE